MLQVISDAIVPNELETLPVGPSNLLANDGKL